MSCLTPLVQATDKSKATYHSQQALPTASPKVTEAYVPNTFKLFSKLSALTIDMSDINACVAAFISWYLMNGDHELINNNRHTL